MTAQEKKNGGNKVNRWSTDVPGKDIFALEKCLFMKNVDGSNWNCAVICMEDKKIH